MNDIDFFSSSSYLFLPTKNKPKVALVVDSKKLTQNAFKLYNPFSRKAKIFKQLMLLASIYFKYIIRFIYLKKEKSQFIIYLENKLKQSFIISIYFATIQDKVVLQLQSTDALILGYLKFPLNDLGEQHIQNEIKAIKMLSTDKIVEPFILSSKYQGKSFLLIKEIKGKIESVDRKNLDIILEQFYKDKKYPLLLHPRIKKLKYLLTENCMTYYLSKLNDISKSSTMNYRLVYEHGDFAPWNIMKVDNRYIPFDFEYFEEDGLEYFDLIKYYYQIGRLLNYKQDRELIGFIFNNIKIQEIKELFELFLIKEIIINRIENKSFEFEKKIIKILESL
jgi:hypothetical protein